MKIETTNILERAALFSLTRKTFGNRSQTDKSKIRTSEDFADDEKTKRSLTITKQLITDCDQLDAINQKLSSIYSWCMAHSMQSCLRDGVYFVKKDMIPVFEEKIAEVNRELEDELVPEFLAVYHSAIDNARDLLNGQFEENDYPLLEEMRHKFGITHSWLEFNVPKDLPEDIKKRETVKLQNQMQEAATEMVFALRESFADFVQDLSRRLEVKPGTPGKRFTANGAAENMMEFITRFNSINIANDSQLEETIKQAKAILEGKDISNMAHSDASRERVKAAFAEIKATCGTLIEERPKRKFNLA